MCFKCTRLLVYLFIIRVSTFRKYEVNENIDFPIFSPGIFHFLQKHVEEKKARIKIIRARKHAALRVTSCVFLWVTTSRSLDALASSSDVDASLAASSCGSRLTASYLLTCTYVCLGTNSTWTLGGGVPKSPTILTRVGTSLGSSWSDT